MKKTAALVTITALISSTLLAFASPALAQETDDHQVRVDVINMINHPINYHIDNNIYSIWTGDYDLLTRGARDENNQPTDGDTYIFSSKDTSEYYTISYKGATCKIDYSMIAYHWLLQVTFSGTDANPHCDIH